MNSESTERVALVGASGIGKFHANWWRLEGAEVCAFMGSTSESVLETQAMLRDKMGIDVPGYTDLAAMIETEQPTIVDVCSPPALHYEHVRLALERGCHVLCEKPFIYEANMAGAAMLAQAAELRDRAGELGLRLGICAQYAAGAPVLAEEVLGDDPLKEYVGHIESPAKGRAPEPGRIWIDLAPHPLSVLQVLVPGIDIAWDRAGVVFEGYEASTRFQARTPDGRSIACEIITRNTTEPPANVRHFALNGHALSVEGERDADGTYNARIESASGSRTEPDFMRLLIREFLAGRGVFTADMAITNLDWVLHVLQLAETLR